MSSSPLAESASPYLRAHAENPVAWLPWGEEAFALARERDVPVLVSIGYATCHWCHVMARESFSDPATAALINDGFVAVKVDREEHPEVDAAYMAAAGAFTQSLGWPLTVFATPEGRPFFAGTYWPPAARPPLPSFGQVLAAVREAWTDRRDEVETTGTQLTEALAQLTRASASAGETLSADRLRAAADALAAQEDPVYGGFAPIDAPLRRPKFPVAPALRFLQAPLLGPEASAVTARALAAMANSELRDDVDGGFFRYATRRDWTVPHYERMLTDNAGLLDVALEADDLDTARGIAGFLTDVLQLPSGGFAAAQDSESMIDGERSEGGYYRRDAAGRAGLVPPALDAKVVTGWNGMAIGALARAGARLGDPRLIESARWAADRVLEDNSGDDGMLRRASLDEIVSRAPAALEDWGLLADGLFALAAASGEVAYAGRGRNLIEACLDPDGRVVLPGGGDPVLRSQGVVAPVDDSDGASPSGLAAVASAALAAWLLGAGERYRRAAETIVADAAASALAQPLGSGAMLRVAASLASAPRQVVVVSAVRDSPLAEAGARLPADLFAMATPAQARAFADAGFTLFEGKDASSPGSRAADTLYDCRDFVCRLPVSDPALLAE